MPSRWSTKQRERSQRVGLRVTVFGFAVVTLLFVVFIVDEAAGAPSGPGPDLWVGAVLGISLFGLATFASIVKLRYHRGPARRQGGGRGRLPNERSAGAAATATLPKPVTNEHAVEPLPADLSYEWPAGISVKEPHLGDIPTGPQARGRRYDWVGAGMAMGVWLSPAVAGSVVFEAVGAQPGAWWLVFLWLLGLGLGCKSAWETWRGLLDELIFRVSSDQAVVSGRTGWPIGRHRWIRLDQLTRVSCRKLFDESGFNTYFVVRDHAGAQLMLEDTPATRSILLALISRQPSVHVSYLASRELTSMFTWWSYPLAFLVPMAWLTALFMAAIGISAAMGAVAPVEWW